MKILKILLLLSVFNSTAFAKCVEERWVSGYQLLDYQDKPGFQTHVSTTEGFVPLESLAIINGPERYLVQSFPKVDPKGYDDRYLPYYEHARLLAFLKGNKEALGERGYVIEEIGKSLKGKSLFVIKPKVISTSKKVVLMFGRHHGDEGTANWIIEGFLKEALKADNSFFDNFQLVLYPMVNPDGAGARQRYNSKGKDLNREWASSPSRSADEIGIHHQHVDRLLLSKGIKPVITLDMHGSFYRDFIYRVDKSFIDEDFFNHQQAFIDELGTRDPFQNGTFDISNGHPKMSRILLVRDYHINAMTHETPRDIRKNGERSLDDLINQGVAITRSLNQLYGQTL